MKWRIAPKPKLDYTDWHVHFAWSPVTIGSYSYWLCRVMRRAVTSHGLEFRNEYEEEITNQLAKSGCWLYWEYQEVCYYY